MTDPKLNLDEIMDTANAATEGPWCYVHGYGFGVVGGGSLDFGGDGPLTPDRDFIAQARADVPIMVKWMRRAAFELRSMAQVECIRWMHTRDYQKCGKCADCLKAKAAQALLDQLET